MSQCDFFIKWFNWKQSEYIAQNCLHVNNLESCLTYEELFRAAVWKYTVTTKQKNFTIPAVPIILPEQTNFSS